MGRWGGWDRDDRGGGGKGGKDERSKRNLGWASDEQKARNAAAAAEGRTVYVRGIPPDWSVEHLEKFMMHQGAVEGINLMPAKHGQNARAAFVNFETCTDAEGAAEVCDNLQVDAAHGGPGTFRLVCSLKKAPGKKVDMVSGFSDLSKARQEKRTVYMSGLPLDMGAERIRSMLTAHGTVEDVKELPASRNRSCFAIMSLAEEAMRVIETLDGQMVDGKRISVTYPRPPKRTRGNEEESVVEIQGFPYASLPTEVSAAIEAGGREVSTVKMLRHESMNNQSIALVFMNSKEDAAAVVKELNGFEFMPGCILQARQRVADEIKSEALQDDAQPALSSAPAASVVVQRVATPWSHADSERRVKGAIVGSLRRDGASIPHPATGPPGPDEALAQGALQQPPPAKRARHDSHSSNSYNGWKESGRGWDDSGGGDDSEFGWGRPSAAPHLADHGRDHGSGSGGSSWGSQSWSSGWPSG